MRAYGVRRGLILAPSSSIDDDEVELERFSTKDKLVSVVAHLPMSNLTSTEAFLHNLVQQFGDT